MFVEKKKTLQSLPFFPKYFSSFHSNASTRLWGTHIAKSPFWLCHWQFFPALGKSPRIFSLCFFLMCIEDSSFWEPAIVLLWFWSCPHTRHFKGSQQSLAPHMKNRDTTTHVKIYRPIAAKHSENQRCCLSTEHWLQNLQAVLFKAFYILSYKSFVHLQAQPTSAVG